MRLVVSVILAGLALAEQTPFRLATNSNSMKQDDFHWKEAEDIFSPTDLITLPRPGAGVPNTAGDLCLIPVSEYDLNEKKNNKFVYVATVEADVTPLKIPLPKGGETFWLDGRTIGHVLPSEGENPKTSDLFSWDVTHFLDSSDFSASSIEPIYIGQIPTTTTSNFQFWPKALRLVFSAYVWEDGKLENVNDQDAEYETRGNTALVYDHTYERQWDTWRTPGKRLALFSVRLARDPDRNWEFNNDGAGFVNVQKSSETKHSTPVEPFGGTGDFDVSQNYVVYTTLASEFIDERAWHTRQDIFMADIKGSGFPRKLTSGNQGAASSPVINLQEDKVAWLEMEEDGYEADRNKIVIYDLKKDVRYVLTPEWDRSPDGLSFSKGGEFIYFSAGDNARVKTYIIALPPTPTSPTDKLPAKYTTPIELTSEGAVSSVTTMFTGRVLFSRSSLTSPNDVFRIRGLEYLERYIASLPEDKPVTLDFADFLVHPEQYAELTGNEGKPEIRRITKFTAELLATKNLNPGKDFHFTGAEDRTIQGFTIVPPGFKEGEKKKWPAVLLIHGGPQGAWEDQWSTRWNPNVFAQQGYIVVFMNPTGSTTFGQKLTDDIAGDWGGKPFEDMKLGWKYILENVPEIDPDRAVAAGASWGGYAINWIAGHPEYEFGFKALVCHDGVFDARYNGFSTDELFFFNHEWGGRPWDPTAKVLLEKMNPANFVANWSVPQLIIHGSKDYRLPDTEGIGAFHALQQQGIDSRLVVFPDENHWVLNHGNSLKWHYEVLRWFDKYVGEK